MTEEGTLNRETHRRQFEARIVRLVDLKEISQIC